MLVGSVAFLVGGDDVVRRVELDLNGVRSSPALNLWVFDDEEVTLGHSHVFLRVGNDVPIVIEFFLDLQENTAFLALIGVDLSLSIAASSLSERFSFLFVSRCNHAVEEWKVFIVPNLLDHLAPEVADFCEKPWAILAFFAFVSPCVCLLCLASSLLFSNSISALMRLTSSVTVSPPEDRLANYRKLKVFWVESRHALVIVFNVVRKNSEDVTVDRVAHVICSILSSVRRLASRPTLERYVDIL